MPLVPAAVEVVTLFASNIAESRAFYTKVFDPEIIFEDDQSIVFKFGGLWINLLHATEASDLIAPAPVANPISGAGFMPTIRVDDVNAVCAGLEQHGIQLLNGPIDRPWGRRTATFQDPSGHVWELAQVLS